MKIILKMMPLVFCFMVSCNQTTTYTYTSYHSNAADFFIVNLTTGETVHNGGMVTHVGTDTVWVSPNNINVSYNDVLKLVYQPPQKYEQSTYSVAFNGTGSGSGPGWAWSWNWSHSHYGTTPYETEITITKDKNGVCIINCDAKADDWLEGSSDYGILQVTVVESE